MDMRPLGRSNIQVSAVCLGTMNWGSFNSRDEGFAQMDYALSRGVSFWDAAEMYPAPPTEATFGRTEEIIGEWLASRGGRDRIVLATKVVGAGPRFPFLRGGDVRLDRRNIEAAIDASLRRLKTDYVDLYQLHWPDRTTNNFGQLGFSPQDDEAATPLAETLEVLSDLVKGGKVREVGVSNETPWGVMTLLALAEKGVGPRIVSIQNPYSLVNRSFEVGLAEISLREQVSLLAYAPLAGGALSGKYLYGRRPEGARYSVPNNPRYIRREGEVPIARYVALAHQHGLDPAVLAHAFVYGRPFLTSSIVGATSIAQLKTAIDAAEVTLDADCLQAIESIHADASNPCP